MRTITDAQKLIDQVTSYGFRLTVANGKIKGNPQYDSAAIPPELIDLLRIYKDEVIKLLVAKSFKPSKPSSRSELAAALTRLECGETRAVRLYSHTCKDQLLVLAGDEIPETITVDCPAFSLAELKRLIGSDSEHIKAVYRLKQVFGATVVD